MKRIFSFLLLFGLLLALAGCGKKEDNKVKSSEEEKTKKVTEAYAGPGEEYLSLGKQFLDDGKVIREEKGWLEVENGKKRVYINKESWNGTIDDKIPVVSYDTTGAGANVRPVEYAVNQKYTITGELSLIEAPATTAPQRFLLKKDDEILIILAPDKKDISNGYCQIEANTDIGKMRGYVKERDLFGLDDPVKNFDRVKENNAVFTYADRDYYSSDGNVNKYLLPLGWNLEQEVRVEEKYADWTAGVEGAILGKVPSDSIENYPILWDSGKLQYRNVTTDLSQGSDALALWDFLSLVRGTEEADSEDVWASVELQEYEGNHKIVVKTGMPNEYVKAGETLQLGDLLEETESGIKEDEYIRNLYPDLTADSPYSMEMVFSHDFKENAYGFYMVISKELKVYAVPIIHSGTSFKIYNDGKLIRDAAIDLANMWIKTDEESGSQIVRMLTDNGFSLKDTQFVDAEVQEDSESSGSGQTDMAGTWILSDVMDDTGQLMDAGNAYGSGLRRSGAYMVFEDDGSFSYNIGVSESGNGTYTVSGDVIQVVFEDPFSGTHQAGDTIEFKIEDDNHILYINTYINRFVRDTENLSSDSDEWKQLYIDYIQNEWNNDGAGYALIYINDDAIPELYLFGSCTAQGDAVCTYHYGSLSTQHLYNYGLTYIEYENLFCDTGGHMDRYYDRVYDIEDGEFMTVCSGEYGAEDNTDIQLDENGVPIYQYFWEGESVTQEEYENNLASVYDKSRARSAYDQRMSAEEVIAQIQGM
mgnify:FL=1